VFTSGHLYLTIHGTNENLGQLEQWQVGLRIDAIVSGLSQGNVDDRAAQYRSDVQAWWATMRQRYAPSTKCTHVKLARINPDGKYGNETEAVVSSLTPNGVSGLSGNPPLPAQLAVVVTLTTDVGRGLASKGRIYLPAPDAAQLALAGEIAPLFVTMAGQETAQLIANLNNDAGLDTPNYGNVSVMSEVREGRTRQVRGVAVGRRYDSQRRRAEKFPETPVSFPVP
jgi:hypothetical protein